MTDVVTKLTTYFHVFDGKSKSIADNRDVIDDVIDEKMVIHTANGDISHPQYIERIRQLLDKGAKVDILEMKIHEKGVEYRVKIEIPEQDEVMEVHSIGVLDHGKIVAVEPISGAKAFYGDPNDAE